MFDKKEDEEREKAWIDFDKGFIFEGVGDTITDWGFDERELKELEEKEKE